MKSKWAAIIRSCSFAARMSMANTIKLLDVVALIVALPEYNLRRGQVGTVVDILAEGNAFEVEFSDCEGRTFESLGLRPDQIMMLRYAPVNGNFEKENEAVLA